jgi:hypothetical protein
MFYLLAFQMHSGNFLSPKPPETMPAVLGFCSIVLEGRSVCDLEGDDDASSSSPVPDEARRINQKLQLLIAGTSKEYCEKNVVLLASSSTTEERYENVDKFGSKTLSSLFPFRHRESPTRSTKVIYSGFESMKPFGNVSPNKSVINALSLTTITSPGGKSKGTADKPRPKEGPHCQQFLKKIGLIKIDPLDDVEHACNIYNKFVS